MTVVAGASCTASTPVGNNLSTQAWGISVLTGTKWASASATPSEKKETEPNSDPGSISEDQPMDVESDEWYG